MIRFAFYTIAVFFLTACSSDVAFSEIAELDQNEPELSAVDRYYQQNRQDSIPSVSFGGVGNGRIENSTVVPFSGTNFVYFDTTSYLSGRAHTSDKVCKTILQAYAALEESSDYRFVLMELSNKDGGEIYPHRTHQNGRSADFMSPLLKNGKPYTDLDYLGGPHYMLEFDGTGKLTDDPSVYINFDLIALQILELESAARKNNMRIEKVIWKVELLDELLASENGKRLAKSGIYITRNLSPLINSLHDDHFHIDFAPL